MNFELFKEKEIVNQNNERGLVVSFDEEHITVRYENNEKTYNSIISLSNKFLMFLDKNLNDEIEKYLLDKSQQKTKEEKQAQNNNQIVVKRNKKIIKTYERLLIKNRVMKSLFGNDFLYPPYEQFKKKYRLII